MFITMMKRRKKQKTNYKSRIALIKSGIPRMVIRKSLNIVKIQFIEYIPSGDVVLLEESSNTLKKYGWKGHTGNTTASYLVGYIMGIKAKQLGIDSTIVDIGLSVSSKGNVIYAAVKGAMDAGISIPVDVSILPDEKRVRGEHISEFASKIKSNDDFYKRQFSACLKAGLIPENYPEHFEQTKMNITKAFGGSKIKKEVKS
ncbi:MAG: 50S ribosomal protein L18 [Candidatus Aenigmatarchaeota archaeon]